MPSVSKCILAAVCVLAIPGFTQNRSDVAGRQSALNQLFSDYWEFRLRSSPMMASMLGDKRWNNQLDDLSQAAIDRQLKESQQFLARLNAIDAAGLPESDALSRTLLRRDLEMELEEARFKPWEMPVNQQEGIHLSLVELINALSFQTVKDYQDYIERLGQIPRVLDQTTAMMRKGMADQLMPPRYLLAKAAEQCARIGSTTPEKSPFAEPFSKFPGGIPAADQERLRKAGYNTIEKSVAPAFARFTAFMRNEYVPHGRTEPGIWSVPNGAERYKLAVRQMTTTDLSPDQIHEMGLKQVDAIEKEMLQVARQLGFPDVASLNQSIRNGKRFYATSGQQIFDLYAKYTEQMQPMLPKLFGRLPKSKLIVIPMQEARSQGAPPADYSEGTANGSRPGHINVNEYDPQHRLLLNVEAIAYHEGIPGHHLQISIAQELASLPKFRNHASYTAFIEGWALYTERLSREIGFFQEPYSNYGRLENEMWRAIRLVVDTGVHQKRWSRDQMVAYFRKYTAMDEPNIESEVDRYIAWPGQALAYKLGQLKILELRQYAKDRLGSKFDIRAFHDELLGSGALPLEVLDQRMRRWVDSQK